ncbi:MAG TPA: YtxH domain-containing protein [Ktedonobacteraceae bacterium]|nr:YtxH domain-containing protein [Ktedonobacteraceae bacterium]
MKFIFGLAVGFGLGIAVGLLLAPQSGEDTRSLLGEQGMTLRDRTGGLSEGLRARATDALSQGREMYQRTRSELTDTYNKTRSGEM